MFKFLLIDHFKSEFINWAYIIWKPKGFLYQKRLIVLYGIRRINFFVRFEHLQKILEYFSRLRKFFVNTELTSKKVILHLNHHRQFLRLQAYIILHQNFENFVRITKVKGMKLPSNIRRHFKFLFQMGEKRMAYVHRLYGTDPFFDSIEIMIPLQELRIIVVIH